MCGDGRLAERQRAALTAELVAQDAIQQQLNVTMTASFPMPAATRREATGAALGLLIANLRAYPGRLNRPRKFLRMD